MKRFLNLICRLLLKLCTYLKTHALPYNCVLLISRKRLVSNCNDARTVLSCAFASCSCVGLALMHTHVYLYSFVASRGINTSKKRIRTSLYYSKSNLIFCLIIYTSISIMLIVQRYRVIQQAASYVGNINMVPTQFSQI